MERCFVQLKTKTRSPTKKVRMIALELIDTDQQFALHVAESRAHLIIA